MSPGPDIDNLTLQGLRQFSSGKASLSKPKTKKVPAAKVDMSRYPKEHRGPEKTKYAIAAEKARSLVVLATNTALEEYNLTHFSLLI